MNRCLFFILLFSIQSIALEKSSTMTYYDQLDQYWGHSQKTKNIKEFVGMYSGRCFEPDIPNKPHAAMLVVFEVDNDQTGPIFERQIFYKFGAVYNSIVAPDEFDNPKPETFEYINMIHYVNRQVAYLNGAIDEGTVYRQQLYTTVSLELKDYEDFILLKQKFKDSFNQDLSNNCYFFKKINPAL